MVLHVMNTKLSHIQSWRRICSQIIRYIHRNHPHPFPSGHCTKAVSSHWWGGEGETQGKLGNQGTLMVWNSTSTFFVYAYSSDFYKSGWKHNNVWHWIQTSVLFKIYRKLNCNIQFLPLLNTSKFYLAIIDFSIYIKTDFLTWFPFSSW